jgi:hypothetical protein
MAWGTTKKEGPVDSSFWVGKLVADTRQIQRRARELDHYASYVLRILIIDAR